MLSQLLHFSLSHDHFVLSGRVFCCWSKAEQRCGGLFNGKKSFFESGSGPSLLAFRIFALHAWFQVPSDCDTDIFFFICFSEHHSSHGVVVVPAYMHRLRFAMLIPYPICLPFAQPIQGFLQFVSVLYTLRQLWFLTCQFSGQTNLISVFRQGFLLLRASNIVFFSGLRIRIHFIRIRIQHFRLNTDPDPIRIQGFNDQKLKKIKAEKN